MTAPAPGFKAVVAAMETIAPLALADTSWDNVGIMAETPKPQHDKTVMLTIDYTEAVLKECADIGVGTLVAYHPPIFRPMKSLKLSDHKAMLILHAIANGMSIYSPHSALDSTPGGINDWLARGLDASKIAPIIPAENAAEGAGVGRVATVDMTIADMVAKVKAALGVAHVRLALAPNHALDAKIGSVAICAGSGGSVVTKARGADVYYTGEMSHHEVLAANAAGITCVLLEHTLTERGYLAGVLRPLLAEMLPGYTIHVSKADENPIKTV